MVTLKVNGQSHSYDGDPSVPLLWVMRDELGLTGTKFGCGKGLCGACTVHLGGVAVRSCSDHGVGGRRAARSSRSRVSTPTGNHPVQRAWRETSAPQCGYCHAGQIMQAAALLAATPKPTDAGHPDRHVRQHLSLRLLSAHRGGRAPGLHGSVSHDPHVRDDRDRRQAGIANVSRRFVMKGIVGSGALVLGTSMLPRPAMSAWNTGAGKMPGGTVNDPHVYIAIDPSGLVTIVTNRSEMGTGVRTSLPMVVADEMEADWSRVRVAQAPGDEKKYGNQDTDGSRSVRHFVQPMRQCGAAMRMMLEQAAATRWGVDGRRGARREPQGRASRRPATCSATANWPRPRARCRRRRSDSLKLKDPRDFRYIGTGSIPSSICTTSRRDRRRTASTPRSRA